MIRDVLQRARGPGRHRFLRPVLAPSTHRAPAPTNRRTQRALTGNVDLAVLHPENQSRTHVTPLIDKLAVGLFQEHLEVVGAKQPDKRDMAQVEKTGRAWFIKLLERWQKYEIKPPKVEFRPSARIAGDYWKSMKIDGTEYSVSRSCMWRSEFLLESDAFDTASPLLSRCLSSESTSHILQ